ncbi:MAG: PhzF family phenazine biosynthesis isomerase [Bacilli bacterium]
MSSLFINHYDAFSAEVNMGNPAGVVLDSEALTEEQMQYVASVIGFNETVFVMRSTNADYQIRYFTPGHEIDLCGHGTVAAVVAMKTGGWLDHFDTEVTIETKAGILSVELHLEDDGWYVTLHLPTPQFEPFSGSIEQLAASLAISSDDIDHNLPIMYANAGPWTLLVPVKSLDVCKRMIPNNEIFPSVLTQIPNASIHPFCLETYDMRANMHGRHFSSPYSGTIEDPVTGTASAAMGAYYERYIEAKGMYLVEQGQEIGRNGSVWVNVGDGGKKVMIAGTAVFVRGMEVELAK